MNLILLALGNEIDIRVLRLILLQLLVWSILFLFLKHLLLLLWPLLELRNIVRSQLVNGQVIVEHQFVAALPVILHAFVVVDVPLNQLPDSVDPNWVVNNGPYLQVHLDEVLRVNVQSVDKPLRVSVDHHILNFYHLFYWLVDCVVL